MQATPEFQAYVRTHKVDANFNKVQQSLKIADYTTRPIEAQVVTYDSQAAHIRGRPVKPAEVEPTLNHFQPEISKAISDYTTGKTNVDAFRAKLADTEVPIDDRLNTLIRKHEAGDSVSYNTFGTHIYRQMNGTEVYNRVDKINLNNQNIVTPVKSGPSFGYSQDKPKSRQIDNIHKDQQSRHVDHVYMPRKGAANTAQAKSHFQSNLFSVINQEESAKTGAAKEYRASFKPKNTRAHQVSGVNVNSWEPTADDLKVAQAAYDSTKRRGFEAHPARQSNCDFIFGK